MAAWQPGAGATLLMPSGREGKHLFVVLNDPRTFQGYGPRPHIVLVNVSTVRPGIPHDTSCVLAAGCHPFVKQESFIAYRHTRIEPVAHVEEMVKRGVFEPKDPVTAELLTTINAGLRKSPFTKREFKQLTL